MASLIGQYCELKLRVRIISISSMCRSIKEFPVQMSDASADVFLPVRRCPLAARFSEQYTFLRSGLVVKISTASWPNQFGSIVVLSVVYGERSRPRCSSFLKVSHRFSMMDTILKRQI